MKTEQRKAEQKEHSYLAIDLKSFYASVECIERDLDPLTVNLVVADASRTEKTICLAVSPALKSYGIPGRARLFEVVQRVTEVNAERQRKAPGRRFTGSSYDAEELRKSPELKLDYIAAPPRMALYIDYSTRIYNVYLKYVAPEDIHVYSIDEVFIDATAYLNTYELTAKELAKKMIEDIYQTTGITATAGVGTNLYLAKVAMDMLYRLFGVNAELLIDHAWGWESCTIAYIKQYKPEANSIGSGQVLQCPYTAEKAKLIVREMTDLLVLDLVDKGLVTDQIVLTVGYDIENLKNPEFWKNYRGEIKTDHYGRKIPKHAHGTVNLKKKTSSTRQIMDAVIQLYDEIVNPDLLVRRIYLSANRVVEAEAEQETASYEQMDLFTDYKALEIQRQEEKKEQEKEARIQHAVLDLKKKFGKNAVLKGMNLEKGAMTMERNKQIGGHKA